MLNTLINYDCFEKAESFYKSMKNKDNVTYCTMISGYGKWHEIAKAEQIYDLISKNNNHNNKKKDIAIENSLLNAYILTENKENYFKCLNKFNDIILLVMRHMMSKFICI